MCCELVCFNYVTLVAQRVIYFVVHGDSLDGGSHCFSERMFDHLPTVLDAICTLDSLLT